MHSPKKNSLIILAPMAGITDLPFRMVCKEQGADVVYSEMISAAGLFYNKSKTLQLLPTCLQEQPMVLQLFGSNPDHFAVAAEYISQLPLASQDGSAGVFRPAGIDINFGCPVRKVMKQNSGCALMRDPDRSRAIIQAVCDNASLPVSIKIRAGIDGIDAIHFLDHIADLPWEKVMVHGRTFAQGFTGWPDLDLIRKIKQRYPDKIVIANGGITTPKIACDVLDQTHADGVAIARGALGNPWIFAHINTVLAGEAYAEPTASDIVHTIKNHAELFERTMGPDTFIEMRKHLMWYVSGFPNARLWRKAFSEVSTRKELEAQLTDLEKRPS